MNLTLSITSNDLRDEDIHDLTGRIYSDLNNEVDGIETSLPVKEAKSGSRGDPITIGTIILALISSGGVAVGLVNVLKAHIDKSSSVIIKFKNKEGKELEITASNLSSKELGKTKELIKEIVGDS